jgi:ADP-heptose:LPS heptosyltransferase
MKNISLYIIDKVLFSLFFPFYFAVKKRKKNDQGKVFLLSRLDLIGDVLMTTCAIRAIKEEYPTAKIYLLISPACSKLVELNPFIDGIFYFEWPWPVLKPAIKLSIKHFADYYKLYRKLRAIKADIFIEFRGDIRIFFLFGYILGIPKRVSSLRMGGLSLLTDPIAYHKEHHELERVVDILSLLKIPVIRKRPEIFFSSNDSLLINNLLINYLGDEHSDYAILSPFSGKRIKEWQPEKWTAVGNYLFKRYQIPSFIIGQQNNKTAASYIAKSGGGRIFDITGETSLTQLAVLMSKSMMVLGVDSGPLHLASCFDIPILSLFGPTNQKEFRPFSPYTRVIDLGICVCDKNKHDSCFKSKNGFTLCMTEITNEIVCAEIDKVFAGGQD